LVNYLKKATTPFPRPPRNLNQKKNEIRRLEKKKRKIPRDREREARRAKSEKSISIHT